MLRLGIAALALVVVGAVTPAHAAGAGSWRSLGMYPASSGGAGPVSPMPMVESKVDIVVRGAIVEAIVTQAFVNKSDRATEATYIFPLPHDAAVSAMSIQIGTKTIHAAIEKRGEAQRRYEAAVRAGVMAATTEQERADVFTQTIAAVPAKGRVEIVLRFDATASLADGTWMLALPMVVAPRFVPGTASGRGTTGSGRSPDTDRAPDASRITPGASPGGGGPTTVTMSFADAVKDVTSPTHDLKTTATGYAFVDKVTDHDAVIRWTSASPAVGWIEPTQDGGFAAVVVQAPGAPAKRGPLRAMFVLDRAATMKGDATLTSQPFVRAWFGKLRTDDRVALHGASNTTWVAADTLKAIEAAWRRPGAPFDLTRTLQAAKPEGAPLVILTDGLVADDSAALLAAKKVGVPIHVIGVGAAPARGLLVRIAGITGGTVRFVQPADDFALAAHQLAADLASPPSPVAVNWGTLSVSDVVPASLPRLGAGQAMIVVAKVRRTHAASPTANIRVRGELFAIETLSPAKPVDGAVTPVGALARRWAKLRLDDLLVGTENVAKVTTHALAYGLVSPYTTLVAIGNDVVIEGGVKHSVAVPVSVPAGMHWVDVKQETTPSPAVEGDVVELSGREGTTVATADKTPNTTTKPPTTKPTEKKPPAGNVALPPKPDPRKLDDARRPMSDRAQEDDEPARKKKPVMDGESADEEEDPTDRDGGGSIDVATAAPPEASQSYGSVMESEVVYRSSARRGFRLSVFGGGGLSIQSAQRAPLFALGLRFEVGRSRNLVGLEGSLFGVGGEDGLDTQGRALLSFSRLGVFAPFLELGAGLGAHVGAGIGPAWSLSMRVRVTRRVGGYVRYDGAALRQEDDTSETQTTTTLGVEASF
ncbi:MAG: VIT domain-containing protein [Kofleriaceae bacterium]